MTSVETYKAQLDKAYEQALAIAKAKSSLSPEQVACVAVVRKAQDDVKAAGLEPPTNLLFACVQLMREVKDNVYEYKTVKS